MNKESIKVYGGNEMQQYKKNIRETCLDKARFSLIKKSKKNIINNKRQNEISKCANNDNINIHSWYKYKNWNELENNREYYDQYLNDKSHSIDFLYDWTLVLKEVMPLVSKNVEYIGVIRAKDDKKTLYVYKMEASPIDSQVSEVYLRSVPADLVNKYASIPGYFLFHTHPHNCNIQSEPFPSDTDIYGSVLTSMSKHFMGELVIGIYGVICYYLNPSRVTYFNEHSRRTFFTFCYDLIMAWNSVNSVEKFTLQQKIDLLNAFGITMLVVPSSLYISDSRFKFFIPYILSGKFIDDKYELLDYIKSIVVSEEQKENYNSKKIINKK